MLKVVVVVVVLRDVVSDSILIYNSSGTGGDGLWKWCIFFNLLVVVMVMVLVLVLVLVVVVVEVVVVVKGETVMLNSS
ncbi:hypothetical protein E2C01_064632 [Portunus trituberculatus]|uniref:Transmembrane protein n=1 Tax=Portunus trituberculatus TaxID=210409 RepID=A0A5B7HLC2_PORTR|nr:hypothetical protein [Portunus trituberculatus]